MRSAGSGSVRFRSRPEQHAAGLLRTVVALLGFLLSAAATMIAAAGPFDADPRRPQTPDSTFVGAAACGACHTSELAAWRGSHHDLAIQEATNKTVLGDFDDATFTYADVTSNTYWDWYLDHAFLLVPAQQYVGKFVATFKDYPPRQKAASFTIDQVLETMQKSGG
jgi:hypothetical protein